MDMNEYCLHAMVRDRVEEMRAAARAASIRRPRSALRLIVGHALVRLGNRLAHGLTEVRAAA
jgi:hypothetical protein